MNNKGKNQDYLKNSHLEKQHLENQDDQMPSLEYAANPHDSKNNTNDISPSNINTSNTSLSPDDIHLSIVALQMARARMTLDPDTQAQQAHAQQNIVRRLSIVKEKIEQLNKK